MMALFAPPNGLAHRWDLTPAAAERLQQQLAKEVVRRTVDRSKGRVRTVAGVDCYYRDEIVTAAVVVLDYEKLQTVAEAAAQKRTAFAYRPGLLAFREGPAILEAICRLPVEPDLLLFDGHGIAHPRRFGIASHIGLQTGIPSIGCAKNRLIGQFVPPLLQRGSYSLITERGEAVGAAVRTRSNVAPVFVSIGHRIDLHDSIDHVLHCCRGYRLPETTRRADRLAASVGKETI